MSIGLKSTVLLLTGILLKNYFFPFFNFWDQPQRTFEFFFQSALILSMLTHFEKKITCRGTLYLIHLNTLNNYFNIV